MSDFKAKMHQIRFPRPIAGGEGDLLPLPKNSTPRSRTFGPRPRCSHALFLPNLGMSEFGTHVVSGAILQTVAF